jgi:hypothetical protein
MVTGAGRDGQRERELHRSWIFFQLELHQTWIACPPGVSSAGTSEDNLLLSQDNYPCSTAITLVPRRRYSGTQGAPRKKGDGVGNVSARTVPGTLVWLPVHRAYEYTDERN